MTCFTYALVNLNATKHTSYVQLLEIPLKTVFVQCLKCEDLLFFSVLCDSRLNVLGFCHHCVK